MRHVITTILFFLITSCSREKSINQKLQGIWKVDSTNTYGKGMTQKERNPEEYWEFNEHNNIVYFTKDSIKFIHYYKITKQGITVYENKKSDLITTYNIERFEDSILVLNIEFLDNSAVTWYLKKAKNQNLKNELFKNKVNN